MESCKTCEYYSESYDEMCRDMNDTGGENEHYCVMYDNAIPEGVFEGVAKCKYYTAKGNE